MKILITGSRNWRDDVAIERVISDHQGDTFVFGDCPTGADAIAHHICHRYHIDHQEFRADWRKHGRAAGPIRNKEMVEQKPDRVYAFLQQLQSKGTWDCIHLAVAHGILVIIRPANSDQVHGRGMVQK
jgi:hypothetical protein